MTEGAAHRRQHISLSDRWMSIEKMRENEASEFGDKQVDLSDRIWTSQHFVKYIFLVLACFTSILRIRPSAAHLPSKLPCCTQRLCQTRNEVWIVAIFLLPDVSLLMHTSCVITIWLIAKTGTHWIRCGQ